MGEPAVELVNVTNEEIIALNREFTFFPWSALRALNPIPVDRAEGVYLWDAEGKRYLDFSAQLMNVNIGHSLPSAMGPIIVEATLLMGYAIMEEAGLSFLGFGIQPPTPGWGNLLSNALEHMLRHPWLAFFPGLMIFLTIISINYIGDGLRHAFDPHMVLEQV